MKSYYNLNGNSSIVAYEYGSDYIRVQFSDGAVYLYTYQTAGRTNIEHMKELADKGHGLCSFIQRYARKLYA